METVINFIREFAVAYGMKIIGAIAIVVIGFWLTNVITKITSKILKKKSFDPTLSKFITSITKILLQIVVVLAALNTLNFQTTSLIAIIGAAGLAVGFALQGSLSNFASGVMLIVFRPIKVHDLITAAGETGVVEEIGVFTSTIVTLDNKTIIVPNSKLTGDNIINFTTKGTLRVDLVFGIGYGDDIDKARKAIKEVLDNDSRILKDPAPDIFVSELADSSVNFTVRPWAKTSDYWDVYFDTTEAVKKKFDEQNISIPFPQRDVHMYQNS